MNNKILPHAQFSEIIIGCCFGVMRDLGTGFLENVYKNALYIALKERGLKLHVEQSYDIFFKNQKIGRYIADLVVENLIVIELKCCKTLLSEHQAQIINYLKASHLPVGFLVNFGNHKLEYKRLHHPDQFKLLKESIILGEKTS